MEDRTRILTLPNALSAYRIAITPAVLCMIFQEHRTAFAALVVSSLITDIFDGMIARRWHQETELGTKLDSCADLVTYGLVLCGMLVFERAFIAAHAAAFGLMVGFYLASQAVSLARFHRPINLHLYSSKAMAVVLGVFFCLYFLVAYIPALFYGMVVLSILNNIEEILVLSLLPEQRSNVHGLYGVLQKRRRGT